MKFFQTARARLLVGAVVVLASSAFALNSTQQAAAQQRGRDTYWETCRPQWDPRRSMPVDTADRWESVTRARGDLLNVNSDPTLLASAERECTQSRTRDNRYNIPAYMCAGLANLTERNPDRSAQDAYCAYNAAVILATRARDRGLQSSAHVGRARALEGLGASRTEVINAYRAAINADGSATASVALARHYLRSNEPAEAQELLVRREQNGAFTPIVSGSDAAVAIVELARSKPADSPDKLPLLRAAESAAPGSVAVNSALGAAYFELDRPAEASSYLRAATEGAAAPQSATEAALQLDAFYYRSIMEARNGNYAAAATFADNAGNQPHALRQACLVRLLQGANAVYNRVQGPDGVWREVAGEPEGQQRCSRLGATPEGQLLVGMFWLRRAQFVAQAYGTVLSGQGREKWDFAVQQARAAFSASSAALTDNREKLKWPGHGADVTLRQMIDYAIELRSYFGARCEASEEPSRPQPSQVERIQVERIFEYYKIVRPRGSPLRCMPG